MKKIIKELIKNLIGAGIGLALIFGIFWVISGIENIVLAHPILFLPLGMVALYCVIKMVQNAE